MTLALTHEGQIKSGAENVCRRAKVSRLVCTMLSSRNRVLILVGFPTFIGECFGHPIAWTYKGRLSIDIVRSLLLAGG